MKDIDRAGPHAVPVFLGQADVQCVVSFLVQPDFASEMHGLIGVLIGHAERADTAAYAASFEHKVFPANIRNTNLHLDQGSIDLKQAGIGILQPCVEPSKATGGERLPLKFYT